MLTVRIKPGKDKSIIRKHPWIFSGAIKELDQSIKEGDWVEVIANKGRKLGIGHYSGGSIAVRMLSFDEVNDIAQMYFDKIKSAYDLRSSLGLTDNSETNIYRLVHAEGDYLPGLIIDHYADNLVVQCHSSGMYNDIEHIKNALVKVYGDKLKSIYLKSQSTLPKDTVNYMGDQFIHGEVEVPLVAKEYGNKFYINWITGQKTGFFIDQRENRALLAKYSKGKKVLNTFCYSGGFSIFALNNEATLAHSLDASQKAIDLTDENVALADFDKKRHESIVADTMEFIKDLKEDYDIIILDPPAFAKHRSAKHNAVQGYKRLNAHAMRQIKPGGIIFTFSCSQVIDKVLFTNTIIAAAIAAEREVRILEQLHQPADHPINAAHPEGEYLKGLVIQVL
ncbi:class I SAM-dependent rRNA methyltransferase [Paracrocinitomix mangrovi]|uniref:class I SAM-dependent rRNA methyltransferase n=1 Tax=Paracrocinitomix mangrovi TaxID=2862509 RepID=UPI001C8ED2B7|nr:class I SAM-dependent rRNA methyltransferase [Paracrocinitomix mangrovi]UKN02635.1 class I SAM-dependent rRNA methyltransferase [Paracrocinitomix mangrovi]